LFTHRTVLFTPITTVMIEGENPVELGYAAPARMVTLEAAGLVGIVRPVVFVDWYAAFGSTTR
jgi:hypothetical protein